MQNALVQSCFLFFMLFSFNVVTCDYAGVFLPSAKMNVNEWVAAEMKLRWGGYGKQANLYFMFTKYYLYFRKTCFLLHEILYIFHFHVINLTSFPNIFFLYNLYVCTKKWFSYTYKYLMCRCVSKYTRKPSPGGVYLIASLMEWGCGNGWGRCGW